MKYKTVKLGEYLYIKGRIGWKGLKKNEYLPHSDYRIINGESLTDDGIDWSKAGHITKERYDESPEIMLQEGDILVSKDGTIGKIGYITSLDAPTTVASGIFVIRNLNPKLIDTRFIYNFLCSKRFKDFITMRTEGSVIPHLYQKDFVELDFPLPPIDEQKRIVSILDAISNKIDLNKAINNNLMHVASSLFTKALEDNADTLIATPLGEIADVKGGKRLPKGINLQSVPNSHPYIRVRDLTNTAIVHINDDFEYVDDDTQRGISRYIVATNDVLLSIVGTIGLVSIVHPSLDKANLTENCVKLTNLKGITPQYLFLYLRSSDGQHEIARSTVGAVQAKLPIKNIQAINVPVLTSTQGKTLCETLNPLFSNMESLVAEIYSLTRLKNTLLPKLLSGEIDVSEVEF